jgi:type IV secretory pathway TraG/TraD family ATPase VirD4
MTAYYDSVHGDGCIRVLSVLDEILRTGLPDLPHHISTCLGRNITCLTSAQNISQLDYAFSRAKAQALLGQMESLVFYRPAKADNATAEYIEKCLSYKSAFAQSKTEHEHGESQGESETRRALMTVDEIKLIRKTQVFVEMEGEQEGIRTILAKRLDHREIPALQGRLNMTPPDVPVLQQLTQIPPNNFNPPSFPIPLFHPKQE